MTTCKAPKVEHGEGQTPCMGLGFVHGVECRPYTGLESGLEKEGLSFDAHRAMV